MRSHRWLGAGLLLLGTVVSAISVLGPLVAGVIRYHTSDTTLNQIVGGDLGTLAVIAPFTVVAGVLALRGHPAAPVLALAPATYAVYVYAQLIVGEEYLRLPGNNERWFPLLFAAFVLGGVLAVAAWRAVEADRLPATPRWLDRLTAVVLLVVAGYLVFGLHLPSIVDALRDHPSRTEYVSTPTPFWLVKLVDLGIVVPVAVTAAVGLLRGAGWARKPMYAVVGAYALLTVAVTGMAVAMLLRHDPDASVAQLVAFGAFTAMFGTLAALLYRPLPHRPAVAPPIRQRARPRTV
jgi:hypothetical protein